MNCFICSLKGKVRFHAHRFLQEANDRYFDVLLLKMYTICSLVVHSRKNCRFVFLIKKCCSTAFPPAMDLPHYIFCMIQRSALAQGASSLLGLYMWCGTSWDHAQSHCPFCRRALLELAVNSACMREWAVPLVIGEFFVLRNFPLLQLNLQTFLGVNQTPVKR